MSAREAARYHAPRMGPPVTRPPLSLSDDDDALAAPSLWRDLAEGRAGWVVRAIVAVVLGIFLAGVAMLVIYVLAALVPGLNRYHYNYVGPFNPRIPPVLVQRRGYPSDTLVITISLLAGAAWLAAVAWLFFRRARRGAALIRPILWTLGITVAATVLSILAGSSLRGEQEMVVAGIVLVAIAAAATVWLQALRTFRAGRPLRHHHDNLPDLRCPECGYRMVGLTESRCPECGTTYTLDELIARQGFAQPAEPAPQPAVPTLRSA